MNPVTALCGWFTWKSEDFVKKNEKTWTKALLPTQVELSMWIKEEEGERKKKIKKIVCHFQNSPFTLYQDMTTTLPKIVTWMTMWWTIIIKKIRSFFKSPYKFINKKRFFVHLIK